MMHASAQERRASILDARGCLLIAEVAQAHDGSLGTAHAYIDAVARSGADAVKFQTHIAAAESTPDEPWRIKFSRQDATRYDYWKRMEFSPGQWEELARHAREKGLLFLSTPFSLEAMDFLEPIDMPAWKVASGEIANVQMLTRMAQSGKPVLLSSGMASWDELDAAVSILQAHEAPFGIFQCTTAYPCPPEKIGLNVVSELRERYGCSVGLSDHSGTIYAGLAAAALGASFVEVHVVFSRDCFGPDTPASVTISDLGQLAEGIRQIRAMLDHPVDKDAAAAEMREVKQIFGKSLVVRRSLPAGHALALEDLAAKKPATGIPASRLMEYVGRPLRRNVTANTILQADDVD